MSEGSSTQLLSQVYSKAWRKKGPTANREFGSIQDGGVQDDIDQMTDDEMLEFSTSLEGANYTEEDLDE